MQTANNHLCGMGLIIDGMLTTMFHISGKVYMELYKLILPIQRTSVQCVSAWSNAPCWRCTWKTWKVVMQCANILSSYLLMFRIGTTLRLYCGTWHLQIENADVVLLHAISTSLLKFIPHWPFYFCNGIIWSSYYCQTNGTIFHV